MFHSNLWLLFLQSSGVASFIKKPIGQTEQMSDDSANRDEKEFTDGKNEHDKIFGYEYFVIGFI